MFNLGGEIWKVSVRKGLTKTSNLPPKVEKPLRKMAFQDENASTFYDANRLPRTSGLYQPTLEVNDKLENLWTSRSIWKNRENTHLVVIFKIEKDKNESFTCGFSRRWRSKIHRWLLRCLQCSPWTICHPPDHLDDLWTSRSAWKNQENANLELLFENRKCFLSENMRFLSNFTWRNFRRRCWFRGFVSTQFDSISLEASLVA